MTGTDGGNSSKATANVSQSTSNFILTATSYSESSLSSAITPFKLTGHNFIPWSRSVQMIVQGKGKFGYLDGSIPQPSADDSAYINNSLVMY